MTKYLAQMESTNNQEEKTEDKMIFLFLALNMFILKVDVKLLGLRIIQDFQVKGSIQGLVSFKAFQGLGFGFCVMAWFNGTVEF